MVLPEDKKPVERLVESMDKNAEEAHALGVLCGASRTAASRWRNGPFTVIVLRHAKECVEVDGVCADQAFNALYDKAFTKEGT